MDTTQQFRLQGEPSIEEITCDQFDGQNIVYWEDIEQVFPGVKHVKCGKITVSLMRDSSRTRVTPHCIKHYPGVVLDVVLTAADKSHPVETSSKPPSDVKTTSSVTLPRKRAVKPVTKTYTNSEIGQLLVSSLAPELQAPPTASSDGYDLIVQAIKDGRVEQSKMFKRCFQGFKTEMTKNMDLTTRVMELQDEIKQLQIQVLKPVQDVFSITYQVYESRLPHLFIILPQDSAQWDDLNTASNKFRLYFLCECGEHTGSPDNDASPYHIHLANHKGYDIARPSEFFQDYGHYVLSIMKAIKFGISPAVPALPQLVRGYDIDQHGSSLQAESIEFGVEQVICHLENVILSEGIAAREFVAQKESSTALEDSQLQQLEAILKKTDQEPLGNLFKTVTSSGDVKWACVNHFREHNPEEATQALREILLSSNGKFNERLGRVEVRLRSAQKAKEFYQALEKTKSVLELQIALEWEVYNTDLQQLRDSLLKTNVGALEFDIRWGGPDGGRHWGYNYNTQRTLCDVIIDIMRAPSIKALTVIAGLDLFQHSSFQWKEDFSHLTYLDFSRFLLRKEDLRCLEFLVTKSPNLRQLTLSAEQEQIPAVYSAIVEHQKCPIDFWHPKLRILPPTSEVRQAKKPLEDIVQMYKVHGEQFEIIELGGKQDVSLIEAFAEGARNGSRLKKLTLSWISQKLSDECIKNLASVITGTQLSHLALSLEDDERRIQLLEAVSWTRLRSLDIRLAQDLQWVKAMRAVMDGIGKTPGRVPLADFALYSDAHGTFSSAMEELLESLVTVTSLKSFELSKTMTLQQILNLIKAANFSRLQSLYISSNGIGSAEVEIILDALLLCSTALNSLSVRNAHVTKGLKERMSARGIKTLM
ncbi:hypothetical protein BGX34_005023 [Mortierella sp. NVP85]|nr:hypothetical protein BGX34_005023 [Mortierella sp. NVP85]